MISHETPDRLWQNVGMDLFEPEENQYIVITDYCSKFFEVLKLTGISGATTLCSPWHS